jgi:hypothetical protein
MMIPFAVESLPLTIAEKRPLGRQFKQELRWCRPEGQRVDFLLNCKVPVPSSPYYRAASTGVSPLQPWLSPYINTMLRNSTFNSLLEGRLPLEVLLAQLFTIHE